MSGFEATQAIGYHLSLAHSVSGDLEKVLGKKFGLWSDAEGWEPISHSGGSSIDNLDLSAMVGEMLIQQPFHQDSSTLPLADGRKLLVVPLSTQSRARLLVVGLVDPCVAEVACALADSVLRSHKLRHQLDNVSQQLDQYIFQITANFEELSWLRSLTNLFEICSLQNGLTEVAQATLPSLRQLIYAQALFLFGMPPTSDENDNAGGDCPLLFFDGDQAITENAARELLTKLGMTGQKQSQVWNSPPRRNRSTDRTEIRNYILTPVTMSQEQRGWLLAINKDLPLEDPIWNNVQYIDVNLIEFGTTEAGLLSAMAVMLATHGKNVELLKEKEALLVGVIRAMVNSIDAKDAYTYGHSDRVALISKRIALQLGQSALECEQVYMSGLLHDIGKIGVPDYVLGNPGKLSDEEFALIRKHPSIGVEILKHLEPLGYVLPGVLHHHEAFDGRGYPSGLAGEQIPLMGRIIAVADSYDAMTSNRTYRQGISTETAENVLRNGIGTQWDRRVTEAFFAALSDIQAICGIAPTEREDCPGEAAIPAHTSCQRDQHSVAVDSSTSNPCWVGS